MCLHIGEHDGLLAQSPSFLTGLPAEALGDLNRRFVDEGNKAACRRSRSFAETLTDPFGDKPRKPGGMRDAFRGVRAHELSQVSGSQMVAAFAVRRPQLLIEMRRTDLENPQRQDARISHDDELLCTVLTCVFL